MVSFGGDQGLIPAINMEGGAYAPRWQPRNRPLQPLIVAGRGTIACGLLNKCLRFSDEQLQHYQGVATDDVVLIKSNEALPWIQGATFLGRDDLAPHLYVPTNLQTDISIALLDKAIYRKLGAAPVAVLPRYSALLPLTELLTLDRRVIAAWLEAHC